MSTPFDPDDPDVALREMRSRFISTFDERLRSIDLLVDAAVVQRSGGPLATLRKQVHQLAGLAGTLGFGAVSERASDLEQLTLAASPMEIERATWREAIDGLQAAFRLEMAAPPPDWAVAPAEQPHHILIIEDDEEQRTVMTAWLTAAGYRPVAVGSAEDGLAASTDEPPDAIILDVELPGVDGYAFCRALKASSLSGVPVMFVTARTDEQDRSLGLALGADDYVEKPIDAEQLTLRLSVLLGRRRAPAAPSAGGTTVASLSGFDTFLPAAREVLQRSAASLALIRVPEGADLRPILDELRPRDLVAHYRGDYIVLLLARRASGQVAGWLRNVLPQVQGRDRTPACAGVAGTGMAGQLDLESLLTEADEALVQTRQWGEVAGTRGERTGSAAVRSQGRIVIAEDDPDIARILDGQLRAAGYETTVCGDGRVALDAVIHRRPNLLILDLNMPEMSGFELLAELEQRSEARPRVLVLSASGRAGDVRQAIHLGANDYVIKPFKPIEIAVRVRRLLS